MCTTIMAPVNASDANYVSVADVLATTMLNVLADVSDCDVSYGCAIQQFTQLTHHHQQTCSCV